MKPKLLTLVALASVAFTANAQTSAPQNPAKQVAEKVNVEGRNLAVTCMGEGQPTVVLEAGLGAAARSWMETKVQASIAAFSRVCAYSRAGLGESDPASGQRQIQDAVNDLGALLTDGFIRGRVVLVGHSMGGLIVNMYAHQHPQNVAGLVFLDSSHPNSETEFNKISPPALVAAFAADAKKNPLPESWDVAAAVMQGETSFMQPGSLGDKPVVVLTADMSLIDQGEVDWVRENIWSGYTLKIARAENRVWEGLQNQLAELSTDTRHTMVKGSSHQIHLDNPETVVDAVRQVVEAVRTGEPLVR